MAISFTREDARKGADTPLVWVQWTDAGGTTHRWSDRYFVDSDIAKTRRVLGWETITHALGSDEGALSGSNLTINLEDTDRAIRTMIATDATRKVFGQPVDLWVTHRTGRAAAQDPLRLFRGRWVQPRLNPRRTAQFTAEDYVTILSDPAIMSKDIPKRRLAFGAQHKADGFGEPIIYGEVTGIGTSSAGAVNGIHIADLTVGPNSYRVLVIAGHACKAITGIYYNGQALPAEAYTGSYVLAPGYANWPHGATSGGITVGPVGTTYVDYGGRRYTVVAVRADLISPEDLHKITFDVQGVETVGDGSGTLITQYFPAYLHFLKNFGFGNYLTGAWLSAPTWSDGSAMIDEASFTTAQNDSITRMGDATGYVVRGVIGANGEVASLQDWLQRWNLNGDVRPYMWDGKYGVVMTMRTASSATTITEDADLVTDPPEFELDDSELVTNLDVKYFPHYAMHGVIDGKWQLVSPPITHTVNVIYDSNVAWPVERRKERVFWLCNNATADNIGKEYTHRHSYPVIRTRFKMALPGVHFQPGSYFNLTHREGSTTSTTELFQVERIEINLSQCEVTVQAAKVATGALASTVTTSPLTPPDLVPIATSPTVVTPPPVGGGSTIVLIDNRELGGSLDLAGVQSATAVVVPERRIVRLTEAQRVGRAIVARLERRTRNAGTSCTAEIWNTDTNTLIASGSPTTSTTPVEETITLTSSLPATGNVRLELRVKGSNATYAVHATGRIEIT